MEIEVETLDAVDEPLRGAYVEKDGKFLLDPDKYADVKAQGLKNKNKELLGKLTEAKGGLKRFEKFAEVDDDELSEFFDWRETKDKDGKKPDAEAIKAREEKLIKKAEAKHAAEMKQLADQVAEKDRALKHFKLTVPLKEAALKAGVLPSSIDLATVDPLCRFELNDDGKIVYKDDDGDPTDITPQKFFETIYKELRPNLYKASGAGGSGAQNNTSAKNNGQKVMKRAEHDKLSEVEKVALKPAIQKRELILED